MVSMAIRYMNTFFFRHNLAFFHRCLDSALSLLLASLLLTVSLTRVNPLCPVLLNTFMPGVSQTPCLAECLGLGNECWELPTLRFRLHWAEENDPEAGSVQRRRRVVTCHSFLTWVKSTASCVTQWPQHQGCVCFRVTLWSGALALCRGFSLLLKWDNNPPLSNLRGHLED